MEFRIWLESKGIRLSDELEEKIDKIIPKIKQAALELTNDNPSISLGIIDIEDQYANGRLRIEIEVVNDPENTYRSWYTDTSDTDGKIVVNVAHGIKLLRSSLVHEFIHVQDPKANPERWTNIRDKGVKANPQWTDYIRKPSEFDAFTGEIINSIIHNAKQSKGDNEFASKLDSTLNLIKHGRHDIKGLLDNPHLWRIFKDYYNYASSDQKRKFYQRIFKAIIDAKKIIGF